MSHIRGKRTKEHTIRNQWTNSYNDLKKKYTWAKREGTKDLEDKIPDEYLRDEVKQESENRWQWEDSQRRKRAPEDTHTTPTKKHKGSSFVTPSPTKSQSRVPSAPTKSSVSGMRYNTRRSRRPTMRRRRTIRRTLRRKRMGRRPSSRRTGSNRLVAMIKKVAINQMEPKRHLSAVNLQALNNDAVFVLPLTRIVTVNLPTALTATAAQTAAFQGNQAYFKGIRVDGWIRNASQYQAIVHLWVVTNNSKDTTDISSTVGAAVSPIFYNPTTGMEVAYNNIPKFYQRHPKLHPKAGVKIVKRMKFILNTTRRGEGAAVANGEAPHSDMADGSDDVNFRFYMPLNKTIKKIASQTTENVATIFQKEYAIWMMAEPLPHDVEFGTGSVPICSLACITYFRD